MKNEKHVKLIDRSRVIKKHVKLIVRSRVIDSWRCVQALTFLAYIPGSADFFDMQSSLSYPSCFFHMLRLNCTYHLLFYITQILI